MPLLWPSISTTWQPARPGLQGWIPTGRTSSISLSVLFSTPHNLNSFHGQVCQGEYPPVSLLYWIRSLLAIAASLLLILVGFVLWPVHDVLLDQSYWLNTFFVFFILSNCNFLFKCNILKVGVRSPVFCNLDGPCRSLSHCSICQLPIASLILIVSVFVVPCMSPLLLFMTFVIVTV